MASNETQALSNVQLESTIAKLATKLARQQQAVKDTEAHMSALRALITANTPKGK